MSDPIVEDIKSRLDIVDIVSHYVTLKRGGSNFKGICPFHTEKTPSFTVNRERQTFRCFGCGEGGDVFAFIMKQENIDFPNALRILADRAGVQLPERTTEKTNRRTVEKSTLYKVNEIAAKFFAKVLVEHATGKEALAYLKERGVNEEYIRAFQIGYAPSGNVPLQSVLKKYDFTDNAVRLAGSPDRFRDRIIFPFREIIGYVVGFSGRALHDQMPKYLNTAETELFRKNRYLYGLYEAKKAIGEAGKVILVEGQLDLVLAHQAGTPYTVATSGTALTDDHLRIMRRYSDTLYLALDGDTAGQKATERAISLALGHGFDVSVVPLPGNSDPGEVIARNSDEWREAASHPLPAIDWLFSYYFTDPRKPSPTERDAICDKIFPYISLQSDPVSQDWSFQRLALRLEVARDAMVEKYKLWLEAKPSSPRIKREKSAETTPIQADPDNQLGSEKKPETEEVKREKSVIGLLLIYPAFLEYKQLHLTEIDFTNIVLARLYKQILSWYNNDTTNKSSNSLIHFIESALPENAKQSLQKLLFDSQTNITDLGSEQLLEEYTSLIQAIRHRIRESRIQKFAEMIAQAEAQKDLPKVHKLMQQMQDSMNSVPNSLTGGSGDKLERKTRSS